MARELTYAMRRLIKAPAFVAVVLLSLGLGVGLNATVFSLINGLLLRPLPVAEPESLVRIGVRDAATGERWFMTRNEVDALRESGAVTGPAGHQLVELSLAAPGGARRAMGEIVTDDYFGLLGVEPFRGRMIGPGDGDAVVLGHELWRRAFGGDAAVVGSVLEVNGRAARVLGVAPPEFRGSLGGIDAQAWVSRSMAPWVYDGPADADPEAPWLMLVARTRDGQEDQAVDRLSAALATGGGRTALMRSASGVPPFLAPIIGTFLSLLQAIVALVLLAACANVAGAVHARAFDRRAEWAVRAALGAGRWRLLRPFVIEMLLLGMASAAVGWLVAYGAAVAVQRLVPSSSMPLDLTFAPDLRVAAFTLGAAALAGVVAAMMPALRWLRRDPASGLRPHSTIRGGRVAGIARLLLGTQVALSMVLFVLALLVARSSMRAAAADLGFDPDGVIALRAAPQLSGMEIEPARAYLLGLRETLERQPGVRSASIVAWPLLGDRSDQVQLSPYAGGQRGESSLRVGYDLIDEHSLELLRIPILNGRGPSAVQRPEAAPVAVVNRTLANRLWPDGSALGRQLMIDGEAIPREVVGVVQDSRYGYVGEAARPFLFLPWQQYDSVDLTLLVRLRFANVDAAALAAVGEAARTFDREVAIFDVQSLHDAMSFSLVPLRVATRLFTAAAGIGLILIATGLFSALAQATARRTPEIGVRMSLGASPGRVLRMILRDGQRVVVPGATIGLLLAAAAAQPVRGLLVGVAWSDAIAWLVAIGAVLGVGLVAAWLPARRAAAVEPVQAIRQQV